jgi:hypothetical protein
MVSWVNVALRTFGGALAFGLVGYGCGGESAPHPAASGGTGQGGTGTGGSTGGQAGAASPPCDTVGDFAGSDYVGWDEAPSRSCEGMQVFCYDTSVQEIASCDDTGPPDAGAPAPPRGPCPNVRTLCSTLAGCCEDVTTLIAGPLVNPEAPAICCYLAEPGSR